MCRKVLLLLLMLLFVVGSLFAVAPGSWMNASLGYNRFSSSDALGIDLSWMDFPGRSWVGIESRAGLSLSLEDTSSFSNMFVFFGPAFSVDLTRGILAYAAIGPSCSFVATSSPSSVSLEFGVGLDLGARFRLVGSEELDLALITGAFGNLPLSGGGESTNVSLYVGLSIGPAFTIPWLW